MNEASTLGPLPVALSRGVYPAYTTLRCRVMQVSSTTSPGWAHQWSEKISTSAWRA